MKFNQNWHGSLRRDCFYVCRFTKKMAWGFSPAHAQHVRPSMALFLYFSGAFNRDTAQFADPIFTGNTSKEPVWAREDRFGVSKFLEILSFQKLGNISMRNKNANF